MLLTVGGTAAAIKMTQKDAQRVEEHTGASVEELSEEELVNAMRDLGIQSIELDENDRAAITSETTSAPAAPVAPAASAAPTPDSSYIEELQKLAELRDMGIITPEDFEAKKKQLLGL